MFAAAAIFAQMVFNASIQAAKWLATKAFVVAILAIVLPWVLKGFFIWAFEWIAAYGIDMVSAIIDYINSYLSQSSMQTQIDINLTGVGGYLAVKTGLIEYASIIFTGWGIYWVIAVLAKTPRMVR